MKFILSISLLASSTILFCQHTLNDESTMVLARQSHSWQLQLKLNELEKEIPTNQAVAQMRKNRIIGHIETNRRALSIIENSLQHFQASGSSAQQENYLIQYCLFPSYLLLMMTVNALTSQEKVQAVDHCAKWSPLLLAQPGLNKRQLGVIFFETIMKTQEQIEKQCQQFKTELKIENKPVLPLARL